MTEARGGVSVDRDLGDLAGRELTGALHLEVPFSSLTATAGRRSRTRAI